VTLAKRAKVVAQFRQRRRAELVAAGDIVGTNLIDGDGVAGNEFLTRRLVGDLSERPTRLTLGGVAPPHLLTLARRAVSGTTQSDERGQAGVDCMGGS
jgi:hypothetical protein